MFALCVHYLSPIQQSVLLGYCEAFRSRGVYVALHPIVASGPYLFSDGTPVSKKKNSHCFWVWDDRVNIHPDAGDCAWIWHHGPEKTLLEMDNRVILIPRNDLFEIRGIENTVRGWKEYRRQIMVPWNDKEDAVYFLGHFTGLHSVHNSRLVACQNISTSGLPHNVGLLPQLLPPEFAPLAVIKTPEPLYVMAHYRYVLSLWGNHPFNPRLYRGLEGASLVFHQATPTVSFLEDGVLRAGQHYVELRPDLADFCEKVSYYVNHPSEARAIAEEGHRTWMKYCYVERPYTFSDAIWELFSKQSRWTACRNALDVHS